MTAKNMLAGVDVEAIIRNSLAQTPELDHCAPVTGTRKARRALSDSRLRESYVAEAKPFNQVSEFVSQKTKEAHIALYRGYVDALNRVSAELDTAQRGAADSRHSAFRDLKCDEAAILNSVWLHELYFSNCFDPHSEVYMDSMSYLRLERDFGTFEDWQKDFIACGMACGSGWAVCGYHLFLKRYINTSIVDHSQDVMMGVFPLVVVDMHEHAYFKDYQTDKKSYLVAMMRELNWDVIEERCKKAESLHEVMK